ncbi:MAG TPA: RidA family protein [Terriglobales bacterium]|nr:RidA family protein [Terriglobales bacterium]
MSELPKAINPAQWPRPSGYSNSIVAQGTVVTIAGQIGWDPVSCKLVSGDFTQQARQALANVVTALEASGARPEHLVRLTWFITDREAYVAARKRIGEAYREEIGDHYPAMSVVVVANLLETGAKVEIEATAVVP